MSEWAPIETAPMDGSHVRLYKPEMQFVGYYATRAGVWCANGEGTPVITTPPTMWKPLDWTDDVGQSTWIERRY